MLASVLQDASSFARSRFLRPRLLHPIDGEVVVVDRRPPPHQLDAHRRRAAVEVVGLDLPRPPPAAYREGKVDQRADDQKDDCRRQRCLIKFLPIEWLVDVPLAVAAEAREVEDDTPGTICGFLCSGWNRSILATDCRRSRVRIVGARSPCCLRFIFQ